MTEVASNRLNYMDKKARSVSSRHSRNIIAPSGASNAAPGGVTRIDLAGNQQNTFMDFSNSYLRMTVVNGSTDKDIILESLWGLIDTLEILADGQTVSSIRQCGAAVHQFLRTEAGLVWQSGFGKGTAGIDKKIDHGTSRTISAPLPLNCLFSSNKYIPMMEKSTLSIRITWAAAAKAFISAVVSSSTNAASGVTYFPIDFIASYIRLSSDAAQMVASATGNRFELICEDIRCAEGVHDTKAAANLQVSCGFSMSSLNRVSFAFYPTLSSATVASLRNTGCGALSNFALAVNGEETPRKRIEISATNISEALSEVGIAHQSLANFEHGYSIDPAKYYIAAPSGTVDTSGAYGNDGQFVAMIDTEAMAPHGGDSLYSGLSTLGSVVQLVADCSPDGSTGSTSDSVLVFAQYAVALTLDLNGTQTWVVSI
jgi:hypothetical protein